MANPMFEKLIAKKKAEGKSMSPSHEKAKGTVLSDLMDHLEGMGMDKVKGMKKVTVASDSKSGLKTGLEKAKELIAGKEDSEISDEGPNDMESSEEESESPEHESLESPEMEESEHEEKSPEELKQEIEELKAKLASMGQ